MESESNSEISDEQEREDNLPPLEHNQDDFKTEPVTAPLGLSSEDMQKAAEALGVSIEDLNLKGQSVSKYDRERNDMVASDGKLVSEVVKPEDLANYNQVLEGIKTEGVGVWAYLNEKGDKEISISKVDAEGNVQTSFFEVKTDTVELFDISDSSDFEVPDFLPTKESLSNTVSNEKPFDATLVVGLVRLTTHAQKETAVVAGDAIKPRLETSSVISPKLVEMLFQPEVEVVEESQVLEPIESSRFNLKDIYAEVGPRQSALEIDRVETQIITPVNEKVEIIVSDIQELGIGLIEDQWVEELGAVVEVAQARAEQARVPKVTFDRLDLAEVRPESHSDTVLEQAAKVTFAAVEVAKTLDKDEGIMLIEMDSSELGIEMVIADDSLAEPPPTKVTFAPVEAKGKVTFPVFETPKTVLAKVSRENVVDAQKVTLGKVTFPAVGVLAEKFEVTPAKVTFVPTFALKGKDGKAVVQDNTETRPIGAKVLEFVARPSNAEPRSVGAKVLEFVARPSNIDRQVVTSESRPVVAGRVVERIERPTQSIVNTEREPAEVLDKQPTEHQEVRVNLEATAQTESEPVVLFRRNEPAESVREVNEIIRDESNVAEFVPRAEQVSTGRSSIVTQPQVSIDDEELAPQPSVISLAV